MVVTDSDVLKAFEGLADTQGDRPLALGVLMPRTTAARLRARSALLVLATALATLFAVVSSGAPALAADAGAEQHMVDLVNGARSARGLPALTAASDLVAVARAQADRMASSGTLFHNPNLATDVTAWLTVGENVGYGPTVDAVHTAFMNSAGHRANILSGAYNQVGIGITVSGGLVWVAEVFRQLDPAAAPPVQTTSPFGSLDSLQRVPGGVRVTGWTIDPDASGPRPVHIYVNGVPVTATTADRMRGDVGAAFPQYGALHGYDVVVPAPAGGDRICAYGINGGAGSNSLLGCRGVGVAVNPVGAFDTADRVPGGVHLRGWALDPDSAASITVHLWVDGKPVQPVMSTFLRPDVGAAFPGYGADRAFDVVVPVPAGARTACTYGINVGAGGNALLACRPIS